MVDGKCDYNGCARTNLESLIIRLHEHDDAEAHDPATDERHLYLCPEHTGFIVRMFGAHVWNDASFDHETAWEG